MRINTHPAGLLARTSARRAAKRLSLALENELASFATEAERLELDTILDAYPTAATVQVRTILAKQRG